MNKNKNQKCKSQNLERNLSPRLKQLNKKIQRKKINQPNKKEKPQGKI